MGYKRKPNYHFASKTETGLDGVPLGRMVVCEDYDGVIRAFLYDDATGVTGTTTIEQAVGASNILDTKVEVIDDLTPQLGGDLDFNGKTMNESAVRQIADTSPATTTTHTFNYVNGDMQQITCPAAGTLTIAFSNFPTGDVSGFIVDLVNAGNCTITHPVSMLFAAGTIPTYTTAGTDRVIVVKDKDNIYTLTVVGLDIKAVV